MSKKRSRLAIKAKPDTTEVNVAAEKEAHCKMQRQSSSGALIVDLKILETSEDSSKISRERSREM